MYLFAGLMVLDENIKSKFRKLLPAKIVVFKKYGWILIQK